ncbi:MAG: maleylacetate reductase [Chloroflexota bacterium]
MNFTYDALPNRVIFGIGKINQVKDEAIHLGAKRALILATPRQTELAQRVADLLGDLFVGLNTKAVQHVPQEIIAESMVDVQNFDADLLIPLGGGSTIGLAKGIALENGLPILAIPTTYAGSEMTPIWGISKGGRKTTGRNPSVKPKTVIYDPELLVSLPPALSITSGINAMAHSVEALYAKDANPITSMMAEEGVRGLAQGLPLVAQDPANLDARSSTLYGAWLSATVLGQVGMALHHKLCHTLGGSFGMPHAETHTVILPYATDFNSTSAPEAIAAMARALGCNESDVAGAIQDIARHNGGPVSLRELGFEEGDLDQATEIAMQSQYSNPRPFTQDDIRQLLGQAFEGARP